MFAIAVVQFWQAGRWAALIVVAAITVLSWSTGSFRARWVRTVARLGDQSGGQDRGSRWLTGNGRLAGMGAAGGWRDE